MSPSWIVITSSAELVPGYIAGITRGRDCNNTLIVFIILFFPPDRFGRFFGKFFAGTQSQCSSEQLSGMDKPPSAVVLYPRHGFVM